MLNAQEIVVWQPVLTDHQIHTLLALRDQAKCKLVVYILQVDDPNRVAQGWSSPQSVFAKIDVRVIPRIIPVLSIFRLLLAHRHSRHLFGSPFDKPSIIIGLIFAVFVGMRAYLISEPYSPITAGYLSDKNHAIRRLKARLRPKLYMLYGLVLRRRLQGVFAISSLAVAQYRTIGIPANRIFPFGYFVPFQNCPDNTAAFRSRRPGSGLRLICVANFIERKGIPELLASVLRLHWQGTAISCDFYGAGDPSQYAFHDPITTYRGLIPFGKTQEIVAQYDLLVLPSKYDGWGVVVNEALMAGVAVVCSDRVGAAGVVRKWKCGTVYDLSDKKALDQALLNLAAAPFDLDHARQNAAEAAMALRPVIAAQYMIEVFQRQSERITAPECPWY